MSWSANRNLILARFDANCPVTADYRDYSFFGGPAYKPPRINENDPSASVWIRLEDFPVSGSEKPFNIGGTAYKYQKGLIFQRIFYPRTEKGLGEQFLDSIVNSCFSLFHRVSLSASSPQMRCYDSYQPARVPPSPDDGPWGQIKVLTPYYVIE